MRLVDANKLIEKRAHAGNFPPNMWVIDQGSVIVAPIISEFDVALFEQYKATGLTPTEILALKEKAVWN